MHPDCIQQFEELLQAWRDSGINFKVTEVFRDKETQNKYYAQGRTTSGTIITNAKWGDSYHNYGLAIDAYPLDSAGKIDFNDLIAMGKMALISKALRNGITWGGDFKKLSDKGHYQYDVNTITELKQKYALT